MSILLSHNSSLERLRSVPPQIDQAALLNEPLMLDGLARQGETLSESELRSFGILQRPVHQLVPSRRHACPRDATRIHRCRRASILQGLVKKVEDGVFCAGPELTFVQMAGETSLLGTVVLGHELCGSYAHFSQMVSGFYERPPLTNVERLRKAVLQLEGMRGIGTARRALQFVRDGSASPMETVISCMLMLPTAMGGFGMIAPELNCKVILDEAEARVAGVKEPRIDTGYPAVLVGIEFDGLDYHRDVERDVKRREALSHKGWAIYVLNVDELTNYTKLKEKVALLDAIPRRSGETSPSESDGKSLLKRLLTATRCGVGFNAALFGGKVPKGLVRLHI